LIKEIGRVEIQPRDTRIRIEPTLLASGKPFGRIYCFRAGFTLIQFAAQKCEHL
jgi:hypothetical protein